MCSFYMRTWTAVEDPWKAGTTTIPAEDTIKIKWTADSPLESELVKSESLQDSKKENEER